MKNVLAFDFGASSGRAVIGSLENGKISLTEVHRFSNDPVILNGTVYWDILRLWHEIKQGIVKAKVHGFDSIGIDTWGVDFGLIDKDGRLLENPVHYRDSRNDGMIEYSEKFISNSEMYDITGIQFMQFNTVFQLLALLRDRPELMERTDKVILMPDLFNYFLTGEKKSEFSMASTTQMLDVFKHEWSDKLLEKLNINKDLMCPLIKPGQIVGRVSPEICEELGIEPVNVVAVCGHDTASAMFAVPTLEKDFAFLSCGTWSLFGTELDEPIINEKTKKYNITNEGGFDCKISFLKNIIGLWLIQESRRHWQREGEDYSYADLEKLALESKPFKCFIDPDAPEFSPMGNIPQRVREYCSRTGQEIPETVGEIMRCIYESIAMKYRYTNECLQDCTEKIYEKLYVIGGGVKDKLLLQMTANSLAIPVSAGPIEATVLGNIAIQFIASGVIDDNQEARKIIADSTDIKIYEPADTDIWAKAYKRFIEVING
ncbi:MAG TPA: rhamnulokinase [Clostridiales bacterium]|nr:rhamnulokinase [Clostridiales bacterium]